MKRDLNFSCLEALAYLNVKVSVISCYQIILNFLECFLLCYFTCSLISDFLLLFFLRLFLKHLCKSFVIIEVLHLLFQLVSLLMHSQGMFRCFVDLLLKQLLGHSVESDLKVEFHMQHVHWLIYHYELLNYFERVVKLMENWDLLINQANENYL